MAWKDVSVMSERVEFVVLASAEGVNVSKLCRRFGASRKTGYKWLSRSAGQIDGAAEQQRRPLDDWRSFQLALPRGSEAATIERPMPGCFSTRYVMFRAPPPDCVLCHDWLRCRRWLNAEAALTNRSQNLGFGDPVLRSGLFHFGVPKAF